jgi:hypothetical protein
MAMAARAMSAEPGMAAPAGELTDRLAAPPWRLLLDAVGSPRHAAAKARRFARALGGYLDGAALHSRLQRLRGLGYMAEVPTRLQLAVGAIDMLRFWIAPASADYYRGKGIDFTFHQVLRFLDDPASLVDPTGFLSARDVIIGHVMQVVHANPRYDLELLASFEDGLAEMEAQTAAMLDGSHPRARSIGAIVEDPDYHARLLEYVRAFRRDPSAAAPLRENVEASSHFARIERVFGTLPGALRYFGKMPRTLLGAARHLRQVKTFPFELAD